MVVKVGRADGAGVESSYDALGWPGSAYVIRGKSSGPLWIESMRICVGDRDV